MTDTSEGASPPPIVFAERFTASETFRDLFREGMALVEETAAYLDGQGRTDSRALPREVALAYTTESMRLTTRLMQMASWLLLQRAVGEGEISAEQAGTEKRKVRLDGSVATLAPHPDLPDGLRDLVDRAGRLNARIRHLDRAIYGPKAETAANPIASSLGRLAEAFGRG